MKALRILAGVAVATVFLMASIVGFAADKKKTAPPKPYPLMTCVVSGEKLGGDNGEPYVFTYEGREVKLCCKSCRKDFDKDPAKFVAKIDEAAKKVKPYPLTTCVVSGEKLGGDMGDPYVFVQDGQEVKLCCKSCLKDFKKDPAKYLKKIEDTAKAK
jgi:YHS domain-containing protein